MHVDAVGQWSRQLAPIPNDFDLRADAHSARITGVPAGALLRTPTFGGSLVRGGQLRAFRKPWNTLATTFSNADWRFDSNRKRSPSCFERILGTFAIGKPGGAKLKSDSTRPYFGSLATILGQSRPLSARLSGRPESRAGGRERNWHARRQSTKVPSAELRLTARDSLAGPLSERLKPWELNHCWGPFDATLTIRASRPKESIPVWSSGGALT